MVGSTDSRRQEFLESYWKNIEFENNDAHVEYEFNGVKYIIQIELMTVSNKDTFKYD